MKTSRQLTIMRLADKLVRANRISWSQAREAETIVLIAIYYGMHN